MKEIWKKIPGAEFYEVSNHGRARSLPRTVKNNSHSGRNVKEKILNPSEDNGGYLHITVNRKSTLVHRAAWSAFIGPIPAGMTVNHKDFNRKNNKIENLEICTHRENIAYSAKRGRYKGRSGELGPNAKITNKAANDIRRLKASGISAKILSKKYGICVGQIFRIVQGRSFPPQS